MFTCFFCEFLADFAASVYTDEGIATEGWIPQYWVSAHVCKTCARETHSVRVDDVRAIPHGGVAPSVT